MNLLSPNLFGSIISVKLSKFKTRVPASDAGTLFYRGIDGLEIRLFSSSKNVARVDFEYQGDRRSCWLGVDVDGNISGLDGNLASVEIPTLDELIALHSVGLVTYIMEASKHGKCYDCSIFASRKLAAQSSEAWNDKGFKTRILEYHDKSIAWWSD